MWFQTMCTAVKGNLAIVNFVNMIRRSLGFNSKHENMNKYLDVENNMVS